MPRPALQAWLDLTRSFGLLIAAGLILLSAVVAATLAVVLGRGDVLITAGLWFAFWLMGPMLINYFRMFWIGAPCGRGASSRWMRVHELWQHRWRPGDIYLGSTLISSTLFPFHVGQHDDRHLTTIASNRSGKGRSLILNNLHLWQGSALVIDPKGELCRKTWRIRQGMGQAVAALDPFGLLAKENGGQPFGIEVKYNPLNTLDLNSPTFTEKLDAFVDAFMPDEGSENIHWRELGIFMQIRPILKIGLYVVGLKLKMGDSSADAYLGINRMSAIARNMSYAGLCLAFKNGLVIGHS